MDALIFNNTPSKVHQQTESVAIRLAYLLCREISCVGNSSETIWVEDLLKKASIQQQLFLIESDAKKSGTDFADVEAFIQTWKTAEKVKHKTPQQIKIQKKVEASIRNLYEDIANEIIERCALTGLPALRSLTGTGTLGFVPMNSENLESNEGKFTAASVFLKDEPHPNHPLPETPSENRALFCLTPEFFFNQVFDPGTIYNTNQAEARQPQNSWLHKCFTIPNINLLSAVELQTTRKLLDPVGAEFRNQGNNWIKITDGIEEGDSVSYFQKNVLPHAASLQAAIMQNDLLKYLQASQRSDANIEVWMGEIPMTLMWSFYKTFEVIGDATWNILQQALPTDPKYKRRVPVMILKIATPQLPESVSPTNAAENLPPLVSARKFITTD